MLLRMINSLRLQEITKITGSNCPPTKLAWQNHNQQKSQEKKNTCNRFPAVLFIAYFLIASPVPRCAPTGGSGLAMHHSGQDNHMEMGDAESPASYISNEKCLPFVCSSPGTTQMRARVFLRHTWISANTSLL